MMDLKKSVHWILTILLFFWGSIGMAYGEPNSPYYIVRYDNGRFIVNNSFPIDLRSGPEDILYDRDYSKTECLAIRYYSLSSYPIRLASVQDQLYSVQFLFRNESSTSLTIVLYDLRIEAKTSMADFEAYFKAHQIEYSKGTSNITTPFACFYYEGDRLELCEFRVAVLRHYGDYFFLKTGERPWWLSEQKI